MQGVLAPLQFLVFVVSLALVLRFLWSGDGQRVADLSVLLKTLLLYTIMLTGCAWEKAVFGRWFFAPAFYWEDIVSMLVLALHSAWLIATFFSLLDVQSRMLLAIGAYVAYVVNAAQFLLKLRAARMQPASVHGRVAT